MGLHLGTALALLLTILGVVTLVAKSISGPLRHLSTVADGVRRSGDPTLRAVGQGSDETARLITAFNEMLDQLAHERDVQKEFAASARAADAQRELVEATPIALVVTAIPGHEVLHANPPAERWLAGCQADPWKTGMDSAVRGRFFQQLADRGAVDEFEVRWRVGGEQTWAVLSARRVHFQGQDAVLTAFSPINHLKLMERRLELWAKVFETSGEGILIVDAERRVLTANAAFSRHTGYELQDVIGENPTLVLPAIAAPGAGVSLWSSVDLRGLWHGEMPVRRRNGSEYPAWIMVSAVRQAVGAALRQSGNHAPVRPAGGEISHYIFTSIDISDRKKSEQRIQFLAEHDVLTELPNRSLCTERLRLAMQQAKRLGHRVAVLFIDLDRFKDINDTLGHHMGDGLLCSVAQRLQESVRVGDTVSRMGGDEFVVVLSGVADIDEVTHIVQERLIPRVRQPHRVSGVEMHVSCSVGIAVYPDDGSDIDTLMRHADTAMYQAKSAGKDGARFYTAAMTERARARMALDGALRRALDLAQFRLHWQPRVRAADNGLAGVEGLIRWQHPDLGMVPPADFIALAEETGLIVPIGAWVIEEACLQIARWRDAGLPPMGVSINLSAVQLRNEALIGVVKEALERHAVPHGTLELELTESMVMEDAEGNLRQMHALRALGVSLSIDDFGTGYSSLAYLNRFPIDKLKIDRSFVHDMLVDRTDRAITMAIIGLGHTLGLKVVAEGVERAGEAAMLREASCDELQGYLFARPMPADDLEAWARARLQGVESSPRAARRDASTAA
jgi:diguanylate cyclase (GGDEF)-like protein/PAS domain S-box-containing protein